MLGQLFASRKSFVSAEESWIVGERSLGNQADFKRGRSRSRDPPLKLVRGNLPSSPSPLTAFAKPIVRRRSPGTPKPTSSFKRGESPESALYLDEDEPREDRPERDTKEFDEESRYQYRGLRENEVRLVRISPGEPEQPLHCALKKLPVEKMKGSKVEFQALSYAWGNDTPRHIIFLQDIPVLDSDYAPEVMVQAVAEQLKPRPFLVRDNLYKALKRLRHKTEPTWFWIDALCIDQENDAEKSQQLPKMPEIYSSAWNVAIWLGEAGRNVGPKSFLIKQTDRAISLIPQILNLRVLDSLLESTSAGSSKVSSWLDFAELLQRPWFCRRWVIQEVACANRLSIRIGQQVLSWLDFVDAIELFLDNLDKIRIMYDESNLATSDPDAFSRVDSSGAKALIELSRNVFRKTSQSAVIARLMDLESLVLVSAPFSVSDARDIIYSLLYLAKDAHVDQNSSDVTSQGQVIVADYSRSTLEVYSEFVEYCLKKSGSLDIVCRSWAFWPGEDKTPPDLTGSIQGRPSWIGLVQDSMYGPPSEFTSRVNGDSLVGKPFGRVYNASCGAKMQAHLIKYDSIALWVPNIRKSDILRHVLNKEGLVGINGKQSGGMTGNPGNLKFAGLLLVRGMKLGRLCAVSSRVVEGTIADDCLDTLGWKGKIEQGVPDELWKTLVANRGPDGRAAPAWYRRACALALTKVSPEGDLNTSKLITNKSQPTTMVAFLKRVQAVVWSRKFFRCRNEEPKKPVEPYEREMVGFGSRAIAEGDIVCILFGCSVPVVLRKDPSPTYEAYRLIGECYVHENMEGEMFAGKTQDEISNSAAQFLLV